MASKQNIDWLGAILLIICSLLMGANQSLVKIVNQGLQPVFQVGLRSACAFFLVLVYALLTNKQLNIRDGSWWPGMLAGVFFGTEFLLLFQAIEFTTVSRVSILFYTMPVWTAIAAHLLIPGERLSVVKVAGLILAICGMVIALFNNPEPATESAIIGDLFCIASAVMWAGIVILTRTTRLSKSCPEMQLLYQLAVSAVILLAIAPLFGELIRDISVTILMVFSFQVLIVVCFGFVTWFWLLSVYPAAKVASYSFLSPVFGVFFGWLLLSENIHRTIILALLLVSAGVYLINRKTG